MRFAIRLLATLCSMALLAGHELARDARNAHTLIRVPVTAEYRSLCIASGGFATAYEHPDAPGAATVECRDGVQLPAVAR